MSKEGTTNNEIVRRLDALLSLMIQEKLSKGDIKAVELFASIHNAGLTSSEIGKLVGRSGKDIGAMIATYMKRKKKSIKK